MFCARELNINMLLIFCLFALGQVVVGKTLSNDGTLRACHRSDPNINSCLLEQAGNAVRHLKDGVPEYGIDALDPLKMDFITAEGDLDEFKIKMVMKNITAIGHSTAIFKRFKFDPISLTGEFSFHIPVLRYICDYIAIGRLFVIPLESSAHFDGNFTGMDMSLAFRLKTVERKGVDYLTIDKMTLKMGIESGHMKIKSTNPKQQPQASVIQDFYNENSKLVINTVYPIANDQAVHFYKHLIESYLRRIPANKLLPY